MTQKKKIGIYGGTFNPPHVAHVRACEAFYNAIKPDILMVIPDFLPPHKEVSGRVSADDRLEMTKLAFSKIPSVFVSDTEIKRGGRSYTAVTLTELYSDDKRLYFLCGTDMFLSLDSWYRPDIIFEKATICYIRRENDTQNESEIQKKSRLYKEKYGADIIFVDGEVTELSSSEIREKISKGEDVTSLIPQCVADYINEKGLYK